MKRNTDDIWRERVRAFRASGKTGRAFARANGFHETTLSRHVRRFAAEPAPTRTNTLARVQHAAPAGPTAVRAVPERAVEIVAGRGHVVRVGRGFDEEVLRAVLRVVEEQR